MDSPWMDGGFKQMAAGLARNQIVIPAAARVSFWRAFGIMPDMQLAMEESYTGMELNFSAGVSESPLSYLPTVW